GRGQQRVAQLRVLENLVRDAGRHVAAERLPPHPFTSSYFSFQLNRRRLPAHHSRVHHCLHLRSERLVRRHRLPHGNYSVKRKITITARCRRLATPRPGCHTHSFSALASEGVGWGTGWSSGRGVAA